MALNEWGYPRVTVDVDVLLTPEGLRELKAEALGRGYTEESPGSRGLRDTVAGVNVELVRALSLPRDLAASLDGSVRAKYEELWEAAQAPERV